MNVDADIQVEEQPVSPKESAASTTTSEKGGRTLSGRAQKRAEKKALKGGLTPSWWVPLALSLMVIGLLWVMTYYISSGGYPIPGIDMFNIGIGFAFIMVGFVMLTQWK